MTCVVCNLVYFYSIVLSDSVAITRSPSSATVYTSESLTLTCATTVNQAVDVPILVTHQWVGPQGAIYTGSGVTVSAVTASGLVYSSTVTIAYLSSSHSGTYECSSTLSPAQPSVFIESSITKTASTDFTACKHRTEAISSCLASYGMSFFSLILGFLCMRLENHHCLITCIQLLGCLLRLLTALLTLTLSTLLPTIVLPLALSL